MYSILCESDVQDPLQILHFYWIRNPRLSTSQDIVKYSNLYILLRM